MKVTDYITLVGSVATNVGPESLAAQVRTYLENGWQPFGKPQSIGRHDASQILVLREPDATDSREIRDEFWNDPRNMSRRYFQSTP